MPGRYRPVSWRGAKADTAVHSQQQMRWMLPAYPRLSAAAAATAVNEAVRDVH